MNWRPGASVLRAYLQGGLGNQLFTFIGAWVLCKENNLDLELDFRYIRGGSNPNRAPELLLFDLPVGVDWPKITIRGRHLEPRRARIESGVFRRLPRALSGVEWANDSKSEEHLKQDVRGGIGIFAMFQSLYFADRAEKLGLDLRMPVMQMKPETVELISQMRREQPIALHVRRGDYLGHAETLGVLDLDYYARAVNTLRNRGVAGQIWLFTDDEKDLTGRLENHLHQAIRDVGAEPEMRDGFNQFVVLREASAMVIANSSFGWWAARMARGDVTVAAPRPWFVKNHQDLVHHTWISVPSQFPG